MILEDILNKNNILESIYNNLDELFILIPELRNMIGFEHKHPHHHLDVWNHTLYAISLAPNDFEIRLVLLLHDIGKPYCYIEGDTRKFTDHSIVSKNMAKVILERLHYEKDFIDEVCYLVEYHDYPITLKEVSNNRDLLYKRYLIQYCDMYAHHPDKLEKRIKYLNRVKKYFD